MSRKIKIFTDASSVAEIRKFAGEVWVSGFTTNPTLMRKSGASDYHEFALAAIDAAGQLPLSLEVVADDPPSMIREGRIIGSWGSNVNVKIPITTTDGVSCLPAVKELLDSGIKVNITAIMADSQVEGLLEILRYDSDVIISVFAGRIADTGVDPVPLMTKYAAWIKDYPNAQLLWASPREVLNLVQAEECNCHIFTATPEILNKIHLLGKDLEEFSRETVQMFYEDARSANFKIP